MKSKILVFFIPALLCALNIFAANPNQDMLIIQGRVIDKANQEPIPYVNIGVIGEYMGTITNLDGDFELKVPKELSNKDVQISAVGYEVIVIKVGKYAGKTGLVFELIPKDYKINEVEVSAKSLFFVQIIKKTVENIEKNYLQKPFNYDIYYRSQVKTNENVTKLREAAMRIYDKKGYKRNDVHRVYKDRGYKFLQVKQNYQPGSLVERSTRLDDLLEMDIVRTRGNILDTNHLELYEMEIEKITEYDNDSVWVIAYKCTNPDLSTTGDYYATEYSGKIYINKSENAVVKNETTVVSSNFSPHGRSLYINPDRQKWHSQSVKYTFTSIYKKQADYYYLSYVNYIRHHQLLNKETGEQKQEEIHTELMVNKIETANPEVIRKRAYYQAIPYDENFWKNFNYIFDKE